MPEIPYRPFHRPKIATETEVSAMFEKLAKHQRPTVEVYPNCIPSGIQLKWKKPVVSSDGSVHITSVCGAFQIERRGDVGHRKYFAMTLTPEFRRDLACKASADEAKAACEAEAGRRAARAAVPPASGGDGSGAESQ